VSRFLLLLLFLIWMAWRSEAAEPQPHGLGDLVCFFAMYGLLVAVLAAWSRLLARRIATRGFRRGMRYFGKVQFAAQLFIPTWLAVGTFFLGWGPLVQSMLGPVAHWPVQVPGALIGTLPALLTWMGLWWAQYPADRAIREQGLLVRIENDLPVTTSPSLGDSFRQNFRLQILFTAAPIVLILALHDVLMVALSRGLRIDAEGSAIEGIVTLFSALTVFITSPILLARILGARPLPHSELRDRLAAMAGIYRLKFRNILLWPTHNRIANALVMGVVPRFRYVLLSDLMLEEMSDEQIEAVFAHELGHVVHRHMIWYLVFMKVLILVLAVIAFGIQAVQRHWVTLPAWVPAELLMTLIGFGAFLLAFGYISRRFERQADVFAARTLELHFAPPTPQPALVTSPIGTELATAAQSAANVPVVLKHAATHVGPLGAAVFASALERVALINNMPMGSRRPFEGGLRQRLGWFVEQFADLANNWLHGSISSRMRALQQMSADPAHTRRFDKRMARLYVTLLVALLASAATAWCVRLPI
jgi:STE24 endopeptidase